MFQIFLLFVHNTELTPALTLKIKRITTALNQEMKIRASIKEATFKI